MSKRRLCSSDRSALRTAALVWREADQVESSDVLHTGKYDIRMGRVLGVDPDLLPRGAYSIVAAVFDGDEEGDLP